ncbi:helix-turn-helix transcriptional regulator [Paracidovorax sp. MALMAid1276]|uniref:helix-turn-helix transcriptional regulator n=1 Tax=Paracidovorax sp. MALMAid1276 TaxID=3411631 RepID=UPI003B9C902E
MPKKATPSAEYPQAVLQQIEQLGQHIAIARKRRGETQAEWARRLGVSQPTMARIERGDPSVAVVSYVMCMWLVDPAVAVADLVAPQHDSAALEREVSRVRKPRSRAAGSSGAASPRAPLAAPAGSSPGAAAGLAALLNPGASKAAR